MSNELFPTLRGRDIQIRRRPAWATSVRTAASGREYRAGTWQVPKGGLVLSYEFLRSGGSDQELEQIEGFFHRHRGQLFSFLFLDDDDCVATDQVFGLGDGVTTVFPLVRARGGYVQTVNGLSGAPVVKVSGVTQTPTTHYSYTSAAVLTFVTAPAAGATLTWSGQYLWRMRFAQDELATERFLWQLYKAGQVELRYAPHG